MNSKLLAFLFAALLGAAIALPTPATAFRGGSFGGGGMHFGGGGFGGGGMHFGGGVFRGGGMHFGGAAPFAGGGFRGGMVTGRSVFVPGAGRFAGQRFGFNRFNNFAFRHNAFFFRHHPFFFRHHHFRNFAFFGAPFAVGWGWPYYYDSGYNGCWQQVWTGYGYQWVNVCYDYGNYGY